MNVTMTIDKTIMQLLESSRSQLKLYSALQMMPT